MKVNLWIVWDMTKTPPAPVMGKKTRALARGWAKFYACWSPVFRITCVKNVKVPR
jgi:hypothetical protein